MALEHSSSPKEMNTSLYKLIEPVFATAFGGIGGALCGRVAGMVMASATRRSNPRALASLWRTQYARACAREFSAMAAAGCGIDSAMRGIRGKDDLTNKLVSSSGAGLALSFAMKGWKLKPAHALGCAAGFAFASGTIYKVEETIRSRNAQNAFYTETRAMLSKLGLEEYEKSFKKGHFTDLTLPLLTDSDLQEVNIPPGARRLILDHIKRYHKMANRK